MCNVKGRGFLWSFMFASSGVLLPLRLLQGLQQATRFSQELSPARERGNTWSNVNSDDGSVLPQYWQV